MELIFCLKAFIPLQGGLNFRDFGGYRTLEGGTVKKGKLFRCGMLALIPDHALDEFEKLDIGVICDLRKDDEVEKSPPPTASPFRCRVHIPIAPGSSPQLSASFEDETHNHEDRKAYMTSITREIARDHGDAYKSLFDELLAVDNGFLLHCTAGKDRTGFGAAMILTALGVSEADIFSDYLLTNRADELFEHMAPNFRAQYGDTVDEASLQAVAGVRHEYLRAALDQVNDEHGSTEGYLDAIGVNRQVRSELRARLVESS